MSAAESATPEKVERYFTAYHCDRDPFSDEGISGLFFSGGERGKIVDELLHACRFMRSPVLLSGRQGSGKTAVLREFMQKAQGSMDVALVGVELLQSEQQILASALQALGQPVASESPLLEQFVSWVGAQTSRQRHVVICFDNADNLNRDFLRPFFELAQHTEGYFTLVMTATPDFEHALEPLCKYCDFTLNTIELPSFDDHQVLDYASYRLQAAGFKGDIPLTDIQVKAAQRRSNGNIAYLNELLRDMLVAGRQSRRGLKLDFPRLHAALALLLLIIVLLVATRSQQPEDDSAAPPLRLETVPGPPAVSPAHNSTVADTSEDVAQARTPEPVSEAQENAETDSVPEVYDRSGGAASETASVVLAAQADSIAVSHIQGGDNVEPQLEGNAALQPTTDPLSGESGSTGPGSAKLDTGRPVSAASVPSPLPAPQAPQLASAVEARLSRWPDTGYALQVFGTHNAQRARQLVADFSTEADLLFYETLHNGKPWFVVIAGPFTGRQSAQASISDLPSSLQRLRPWPRNVASIKGDIERYRLIQKRKLN